jgi:peptidyl-prolyl cis-trans isomerase B (cyclophilin B)
VPPSRDQQLARARAARRAQRAKERERRKRIVAWVLVGALVLSLTGVGIGIALSGGSSNNTVSANPTPTPAASDSASAPATTAATPPTKVACNGPKETLTPATRTFSKEPPVTIDTSATYTMTLDTSCGPITIALDAAKAPHTVNLLAFLAADKFYDGSYCHRSTDTTGLTVLQCGDPTGTGAGSIGFTIKEENLKGATYPRGTLAMANTGQANSTSSQFFLVDKDAQLPASYTVAGHITSGLDVLDKLQAVGNDGANGTGDGHPKEAIYLEKVTVAKS